MYNLDYDFAPMSIKDNNFVMDWIDDLFDNHCTYNEKIAGFIGERYVFANLDSIHPNELTFKVEDDDYAELQDRLGQLLLNVSKDKIYFRFIIRNDLFCVAFYEARY